MPHGRTGSMGNKHPTTYPRHPLTFFIYRSCAISPRSSEVTGYRQEIVTYEKGEGSADPLVFASGQLTTGAGRGTLKREMINTTEMLKGDAHERLLFDLLEKFSLQIGPLSAFRRSP